MSTFGSNSRASDVTAKSLGVWISPGLGMGFPELKSMLLELYRDRVSTLNFVPSGWYAAVKKLQDSLPNDLVRIAPTQNMNGSETDDAPDWAVQNPTVSNAWQSLFKATNEVIVQYAQQQQSKGKAELDRLYANARFWNTAYQLGSVTGINAAQAAVKETGQGLRQFYADHQFNIKMTIAGIAIVATLWVLTPYIAPLLRARK